MIRILTDKGVSLDIDPSAEFEIEYENPMLDDSHMPVPFSTSITFLSTPVNCKVFGYLSAMMLEPSVKKLSAVIEVGGIPLFYGTLLFDSIEEKHLNYTFAGRDIQVEWSKKLWQLDIRKFRGRKAWYTAHEVSEGREVGICTPPLINPEYVAKSIYQDDAGKIERVNAIDKYMNCPVYVLKGGASGMKLFYSETFTPVISVDRILAAIPDAWSEKPSFSTLSIIGRYSSVLQYYNTAWGASIKNGNDGDVATFDETEFDLAGTLPDITVFELIKNLSRMRCAAVYYDGSKLKFSLFNDIVEAAPLEWDDKISDIYSSSKEPSCKYVFGFSDDSSGKLSSSEISLNVSKNKIMIAAGFIDALTMMEGEEYTPVENYNTGDVYSGKSYLFQKHRAYLVDSIYHNARKREIGGDEGSSFDSSVDFIPVCVIPDVIYYEKSDNVLSPFYLAAPIIPPMASNEERDSKVYMGYVFDGQMTDSGFTVGEEGKEHYMGVQFTKMPESTRPHLMSVDRLLDEYHEAFANWISSERQCVTADLNLSLLDICNFRMYRLVYFNARRWVVRKLTLTFNVNSDSVSARGEFLSYDSQR